MSVVCLYNNYLLSNANYFTACFMEERMKKDYYSESSHFFLFTMFTGSKKAKINSYRVHNHPEIEIGCITGGSGIYILDGEEFTAGAGDVFIVRPNEQHCVPTITSEPLDSFNLYLSPYFLWSICANYIPLDKLNTLVDHSDGFVHKIHASEADKRRIASLVEISDSKDVNSRFRARMLVTELVVSLSGQMQDSGTSAARLESVSGHIEDIQAAITYMNDNIAEQLTLKDIAAAINMSGTSMITAFKAVTGLTPYRYLTLQRIEKSVDMLRHTNATMTEIALQCGFQNSVSFNRAFKAVTRLTPSEYRNM